MNPRRVIKQALLLMLTVITFAVPVLTGTGGLIFQPKVEANAEGDYDKLAVELAMATAFEDARSLAKNDGGNSGEEENQTDPYAVFSQNIRELTAGKHWGNVGLFVGPRGSSKNTDMWSTLLSKVTIDEKQIQKYDNETEDAFSKYKAFGTAMQKLNSKSMKQKGASSSLEEGLNEVSAAAAKLTNLGTNLVKAYNPAPLVLAMVDANELNTHPDNKLVTLVNNNENLRELLSFLGTPTGFGIPWSFFLVCLIAFLLVITSVLMTLINGRAAGENIRKMMVKVLIGCVAVPIIATGVDAGINFLDTASDVQANAPNDEYISENLNLADWYATGFSMPDGLTIEIDKKGRFVLQPSDIRAINNHTYQLVTGNAPDSEAMKNRMEENHVMLDSAFMEVSFSEPIRQTDSKPWKTTNFYKAASNFGANKPWNDGISNTNELAEIGYFAHNGLLISSGTGSNQYAITGTGDSYGISPIAATNMMRTTFSGSAMAGNGNTIMGAVAFDVDNGEDMGDANMNAIIRFLATFSLVMAAMKGLFSIITSGFGGILGGGAKSALGSSAGLGQALGGVVALVGGVFGIGLIMTMSFTLLDQVYGIVCDLFENVPGGTDLLDPLAELVPDIPIIGPLLAEMLKSLASFIITIMCAMTLPKFGGIPVTLFCQYLSELPHTMAERAQQMENKFTGDFRAGGGRMGGGAMSSAGSLFNQAANAGGNQMKAVASGAGMVAGALLGAGLSKAGEKLNDKLDAQDSSSMSMASAGSEDDQHAQESGDEALSTMGMDAENDAAQTGAMDGEHEASDGSDVGAGTGDVESGAGSVAENPDMASADMDGSALPDDGTDEPGAGNEELSMAENYQEGNASDTEQISDTENSSDVMDEDHNDSIQSATSEQMAEQSMASDMRSEYGSESDMSSEQSMSSEQGTSSETQSETMNGGNEFASDVDTSSEQNSTDQSMAEMRQEQNSQSSVQSSSDMKTMNGKAGQAAGAAGAMSSQMHSQTTKDSKASHTGGQNTHTASRSQSMTGQTSGTGANRQGQPSGVGASRQPQSKYQQQMHQKSLRMARGLANGLQAAGQSHKSGAQRASEVAAGMMHMAGGYVGLQNVTQKHVDAVRREGMRQRDIQDNLGASYTRQQEERQRQQTKDAKPNTAATNPTAMRQPQYNQNLVHEYEQQQWEDRERQREESFRQQDARRSRNDKK